MATGPIFATSIRLGLALAVLGIPTFLMGGTLPALAAALENRQDRGRRTVVLSHWPMDSIPWAGSSGYCSLPFFCWKPLATARPFGLPEA
jgi:hypothetical protein